MATPIFAITDGETRVNLITKTGSGINTLDYKPARQDAKGGGVWADSSLSDGRQLQMRKFANAVDVITLGISGKNQDKVIESARNLTMLLEKAVAYWIAEWQNDPVWLERRGSTETGTLYTLIHGYRWENDANPFAPPFFIPGKPSAMTGIDLAIEHGAWMANPPGESECVRITNSTEGGGVTVTVEPTQSTDDAHVIYTTGMTVTAAPIIGEDDCSLEHATSILRVTPQMTLNFGEGWDSGIRFRNLNVPNSAVITSAFITFYPHLTNAGNRRMYLRGELNAIPAQFSTSGDWAGRTRTVSETFWTGTQWGYGGDPEVSPDISSIVQEIVNLPGWVGGSRDSNMVIFIEEDYSTGPNSAYAVDTYPSLKAVLSVSYTMPRNTISLDSQTLQFGYGRLQHSDVGIRFRSVDVPRASRIISARMIFVMGDRAKPIRQLTNPDDPHYQPFVPFSGNARITGEPNHAPSEFSTYGDFTGRDKTLAYTTWPLSGWRNGNVVQTPLISSVVQEIIDQEDWVPGNDLVLFVEGSTGDNVIYPASFDNTTYDPPKLQITYSSGVADVGKEATCDPEIYVANKDNQTAITDIYHYDSSAVAWSANLHELPRPYDLLPNPIGTGDIVYFGSRYGTFGSLVLNIGNECDTTAVWEYWNGAAWFALDYDSDKLNYGNLSVSGVGALTWRVPVNWLTSSIEGVVGYWVRARVTAGTITPEQVEREPYTVIRSSVDLDTLNGDITAIARIDTANTSGGSVSKMFIGTRSKTRGYDFRQHANCGGQNPDGMVVTDLNAGASVAVSLDTPVGSVVRMAWVATGAMARMFRFSMTPPLSQQYYGRYRAFARGYTSKAIAAGDIQSYVNIGMGGSYRASSTSLNIESGDFWYFDYGIVTLPPAAIPFIYEGSIIMDIYASNAFGLMDFDWIDFILFPIDEYSLELRMNESVADNFGDIVTADSISYMGKRPIFSVLRKESDYEIHDLPIAIASGPLQLQVGDEQGIHWFVPESCGYEWLGRVQVSKNERYLTFRGRS